VERVDILMLKRMDQGEREVVYRIPLEGYCTLAKGAEGGMFGVLGPYY